MKKRVTFKNLAVDDFIHEKELKLQKTIINSPEIRKLIGMVGDVNLRINKTRVQGTYIQISYDTFPEIIKILEDVCHILDHDIVPEIYMFKEKSLAVLPCTADVDYILISDYTLENYDIDMLYYAFGNAVTMIKAGHTKMTTAAAYMGCNLWTALPQMKFKEYLHAMDATSDRGGLLACQSLAAAMRCHFLELGVPINVSKEFFNTDEEAVLYIEKYLNEVAKKNDLERDLTKLGEWWQSVNYYEASPNLMILDLYLWYHKDYFRILEKYGSEVN